MHELAGSERPAPRAERVGDVPDGRMVQLTVMLRPSKQLPTHDGDVRPMPRAEFRTRYATPPGVVDAVIQLARAHGLRVLAADSATHVVRLEGTYGQARAAFQPDGLGLYRIGGREFVARHGRLRVPPVLAADVVAVVGFDQRPIARPHFRLRPNASRANTFDPRNVAIRYGFPTGLDGAGQAIALVEFGGGYSDAQLAAYFAGKGVQRTGKLIAVPLSGSGNIPEGQPDGPDGEVQLDIDIAGSVAPAADLVVYFAPNQGSGFLDAILAALHDETNNPSVISISWGAPEAGWPGQDIAAMEQALQSAMALGITVLAASGDDGAQDNEQGGGLHVDYPASSPYVLGCGGTRLPRSGPEVAWNDGPEQGASGGGFSALFPLPAWQQAAVSALAEPQSRRRRQGGGSEGDGVGNTSPPTTRGVPDIAGDADPATGYNVSVDGNATVAGGTSAVAPLWAGLIALANQSLGRRAGFVNPLLYAHPDAFNDITTGNNNGFEAGTGWDPVTGLGTPKGAAVVAALGSSAAVS